MSSNDIESVGRDQPQLQQMEAQQWPISREEIISYHVAPILNLKAFDEGKHLVTFGSDGQLHFYHNDNHRWINKSTYKLFQCPITAYDLNYFLEKLNLVVVAYNGSIKFCTITSDLELIVQSQLNLKLNSSIISCLWGKNNKQFLVTTESGNFVVIKVENQEHSLFEICQSQQEQSIVLIRGGYGSKVYLSSKKQIEQISYTIDKDNKFLTRNTLLILKEPLIDFMVSPQLVYPTLAVLTKTNLHFYVIDQMKAVLLSSFKVDEFSFCSKLGWGKTSQEVGLYQCIKGLICVRSFFQTTSGTWRQQIGQQSQAQRQKQ